MGPSVLGTGLEEFSAAVFVHRRGAAAFACYRLCPVLDFGSAAMSRPLPSLTPPQLVRLFEAQRISREEFHAAMAGHAQLLIEEMEEEMGNPLAGYVERLRNRRAARRLAKRYGEAVVRSVLAALAEVQHFPPSVFLWNAWHWDVPLHCFLRSRREPVFRLLDIETGKNSTRVLLEHGSAERGAAAKEEFHLRRDWEGRLVVEDRRTL